MLWIQVWVVPPLRAGEEEADGGQTRTISQGMREDVEAEGLNSGGLYLGIHQPADERPRPRPVKHILLLMEQLTSLRDAWTQSLYILHNGFHMWIRAAI